MKRLLFPCVALTSLSLAGCPAPVHREAAWEAFGQQAVAEIHTRTERDAERALDEFRHAIDEVERSTSSSLPDSELARLNDAAGEGFYRVADRDLYRCLLLALDYARASRGAFDPTVGPLVELHRRHVGRAPTDGEIAAVIPRVGWDRVVVAEEARAVRFREPGMALDLSGVAKGFALDVASRAFTRSGILAGRIRIGGNYYVWGTPPGESVWETEVLDPRNPDRVLVSVQTASRGIAVSSSPALVSGSGKIVIDPDSGRAAAGDVQVALAIADSGGDADALSTALLVAGSLQGGDLLERTRRVEAALLVDGRDGPQLLLSASLQGRVTLSPALAAEVGEQVRYVLPPVRLD